MSKPLNEIITEEMYYLSHWEVKHSKHLFPPDGEFQNWWIITPPKHPFLKHVINKVCDQILHCNGDEKGKMGVLNLTGPLIYTKVILKLLHKHKHKIFNNAKDLGLIYNNLNLDHQSLFPNHYNLPKYRDTPVILNCDIKK